MNVVPITAAIPARRSPDPEPHLTLTTEALLVNEGTLLEPEYREIVVPVLELSFRYVNVTLRAADPRDRFFVGVGDGLLPVERNRATERRARQILESLGAIELDCLDNCEPGFGSTADYVVRLDDDLHEFCAFGAYAVPQLRALGWTVQIAADYPYQVVETDGPWFATVSRDDEDPDWFSLELGVQIEGRRVSLLPALIELIESCPDLKSIDSLLRRSRRGIALPTGNHRYVVVPPDRIRCMLEVLRDLYDGKVCARDLPSLDAIEALPIHRARAAAVARLEAALAGEDGEIVWEGTQTLSEHGKVLLAPPASVAVVGLTATLRPYQERGVAWLQSLRTLDLGGVLADDMGLGKTLQTIAHLVAEKEAGRADRPSLVISPTSLTGNWQRELTRFAPNLRVVVFQGARRQQRVAEIPDADIVVTTYPVLLRDESELAAQPWHYLVLDEAQAIKNPRSLAHRAVLRLDARHRLCLTGTPLENNLGELWSLFDFLMPGLLGKADTFRTRFRHPIEIEGNQDRLELLRQRVAPFILRRMKDQVVTELPPKTEIVRPVELDDDQRELYENIRIAAHAEVRKLIRSKGLAASTVPVLDALMKLRQVCCDPRLVAVDAARRVKTSAKYEALIELCDRQVRDGRSILVFSQFTSMLALIADGLAAEGIRYVTLTGSTLNRQRPVDDFQNGEADVFLISLKAGGTGLNLTRADTVIHYDPWWNPAAQAQATDRAYRIGQTRPVFVYNLIVAGSVEERMLALQHRKRTLATSILSGTDTASVKLDDNDVEDLFAPLEG
ncbi:MAG: DEAD/DEAH box helicase [Polyangiaceae bacterium]|nr:DEAD/DEAH box helicase [Polyangiaceae bacterium]